MADEVNPPPTFCLSILCFSLSISIVLGLAALTENLDTLCVPSLPWFLLAISVALVIVSLVGILVSFSRLHQTLFWCNLVLLFLMIVFVCLLVFSETSEIKQMQWPKIQTCLRDTAACEVQEMHKITGCCHQPPTCRFSNEDKDCFYWQNNVTLLCYDCSSCRTSILDTVRSMWRRLHIALYICLSLLFIVLAIQLYVYWRGTQQQQQQRRQQHQLEELEMIPLAQ